MECFKIMDFEDGKLKTLFHGVDGSKTVRQWEKIKANIKVDASDGSGTLYTCGWHVLDSLDAAKEYIKRFRNVDNKVIVRCKASGKIWRKAHSPAKGLWLAEVLEIHGICWVNVKTFFNGGYRNDG
jgi:hypothetical protein